MAIDPAIANPTPIKLNDPMEQYENFLKNSYLQSEIGKSREASNMLAVSNASGKAPGAVNPDGTLNWGVRNNYLAQNNGGSLLPQSAMDQAKTKLDTLTGFQKQQEGLANQASTIGTTIKNFHESLGGINTDDPAQFSNQFAGRLGSFLQDPNMTDLAARSGKNLQDSFGQAMQEAQQAAAKGPAGMKAFIAAQQTNVGDAYQRTITPVNQGSMISLVSNDKFGGAPSVLGRMPTALTPAEQIAAAQRNVELGMKKTELGFKGDELDLKRQSMDPNYQSALAFGKSGADATTKELGTLHQMAATVPTNIGHIDQIIKLMDDHKGEIVAGAGQQALMTVRRTFQQLGLDGADDPSVKTTQEFAKMLAKNALDQMRSQSINGTAGHQTNLLLNQYKDSNPNELQSLPAIRAILLAQRTDEQEKLKMFNKRVSDLHSQGLSPFGMTTVPEIPEYDGTMKGNNGVIVGKTALSALIKDPQHRAEFDEAFGPGTAARVLGGGTPNGANPLIPGGQ